MAIFLKHNNKRYDLPTSASDVDLWQYMALLKAIEADETTPLDLIGAVTGLDQDAVLLSEGNADEFAYHLDKVVEGLKGLHEAKPANTLTIEGNEVKLPKSWGLATLGQRLAFQQALTDKDVNQHLHIFLAILIAPTYLGKDWANDLDSLADAMKYTKAVDSAPIAYFFLRKALHLRKNGSVKWFSLLTQSIKTQAVRKWKSMAYSIS